MTYPEPIERLIKNLTKLPGIGRKTATRLTFFLLNSDLSYITDLARSIMDIKERVSLCSICFNITDKNPCPICLDPKRENSTICVVEEPSHVMVIEASYPGIFRYHVLHGVINPLEGIGPGDLKIRELKERILKDKPQEILIATNMNPEGNATAHYIAQELRDLGVKVSRLASGIPQGAEIIYTDPQTLKNSIENRREII